MIMILIFGIIIFMIVGSYFTVNNQKAVPVQNIAELVSNRFCSGCGELLENDNIFCSNCGIKIK